MCLSVPMQVVAHDDTNGEFAIVERRDDGVVRRDRVNMLLIGPQTIGTWVLVSLGLARETVDDDQRVLIEDALAAVLAVQNGTHDAGSHFLDLLRAPPEPGNPR
ncbi:MAG TPA: HypC/HybG/HupF family hydrogenase formation chaperone [Candidatus Accumulibacter phosphatis]|nr:MAG: hydrogenase 2 accessory protein HypG [Candidatus Accumulibacter sp. SK-11]HAY26891.1 HypC/HybG/HupF family hydrogenase formation chaperone [Accumulibacter sp.]HRL78400.1 HypC/HybG/HupF family hydrogenase formation chaperone [Candidatus Accumulibacter phosphatis]HCN69316.1 HypC/HybG/HupF family hydrogenase formation chaperone [Accumulibacter sp.]HCV12212.1 HypC/HybG/HupF family hydrogenase formation chaperone [Accumulibacter sp.]